MGRCIVLIISDGNDPKPTWARAFSRYSFESTMSCPQREFIPNISRLCPRLFSVSLTGARNLGAVMFPHSV